MSSNPAVISDALADNRVELMLKFLKEEVQVQGSTFDQIDSKTGVALGFTFVAVGQVLASVFRMAVDQNHFQSTHPHWTTAVFLAANASVLLAIGCGAVSRWPRSFYHTVTLTPDDRNSDYLAIRQTILSALEGATVTNDETLKVKGDWAKGTYIFVALALTLYVVMTVMLYLFSIPK